MARAVLTPRYMKASGTLLVMTMSAASPAVDSEWKTVRTDPDGLAVESRAVPQAALPELRVTTLADAPTSALIAAAWELRDDGMQTKYLAKRRVLAESQNERTLFLQYEPPIISPRQCVLRQVRWADAATGAWRMRFHALRFTPAEGAAAFAHLRGEWSFAPDASGATRVTYVVLIDVGGVPALLARGPQQDATVATVREVVERAEATR